MASYDDFGKIWGSEATTPEYTFTDADYKKGWDFVGNLPPTRAMWNALQKSNDEKMQLLSLTSSPLSGKTILFTGDSICEGYGDQDNNDGYVGRIRDLYDCTVYNYGVGGAKITNFSGQACICTTIDTMYADHPDADIVIMEGGINDADWHGAFSTASTLGTWDEGDFSGTYDNTTFYGAVEYMFYKATTLFQNAKLGFVVVCKCPKYAQGYRSFTNNYRTYLEAIERLCEKWGIACIDLWNTSQANPSIVEFYDSSLDFSGNQMAGKFYCDGKHPTARGYSYMAQRIGSWIASMSYYNNAGYLSARGGMMTGGIACDMSTSALYCVNNANRVSLAGGRNSSGGAMFWLYGKDYADVNDAGKFHIDAQGINGFCRLTGTPGGFLTWGGDYVVTTKGGFTFDNGITLATSTNPRIAKSTNDGMLTLGGGNAYNNGAYIWLYGKDHTTEPGYFDIDANDGNTYTRLQGKPDGSFTWGGNPILTAGNYNNYALPLNGGTMTGNISGDKTSFRLLNVSANYDGNTILMGCNATTNGAYVQVHGSASSGGAGFFNFVANDGIDSKQMQGRPNGSLTWDGQPIQTSSDKRLKTDFANVPAKVLEAWGNVEWQQFRYKEDKEKKGDSCRFHTGLVAQDVKEVGEENHVDLLKYGILCHDVREATEDREAVDLWTVRYEEALAMEVIYLRSRLKSLEDRIAKLEK